MLVFALGNHPKIHKRVREEINAVIKSDADITYENLKKLTYIDWIQYETTRMYGPSNGILFRVATEDNYLKDVQITKGTLVTTQNFGCHYNPNFFKDPFEFRPERWEKECNGLHPFAFIGFSAGIRTCIGKQLAYI
jgi:cytochrome P450